MQAHKMKVTVPKEHHLEIRLPDDFPPGPAEIIVLAGSSAGEEPQKRASREILVALENLQSMELTDEEELVLADFDSFRQANPFDLASLSDEDR